MKHLPRQTRALVKPMPLAAPASLLADLRSLIHSAREQVARAVDSSLTTLYWHVGRLIRRDILRERRAGYGEAIVSTLGRQLETEFGRGFSEKSPRQKRIPPIPALTGITTQLYGLTTHYDRPR